MESLNGGVAVRREPALVRLANARNLRLLVTTRTELAAIAAPAIIGVSSPNAARGIAARCTRKSVKRFCLMTRSVRADSRSAVGTVRRSPRTSVMSPASIAASGSCADGHPDVGGSWFHQESLLPSPTIATRRPSACSLHCLCLARWQDPGNDVPGRNADLGVHPSGHRGPSPGQQHGGEAHLLEFGDCLSTGRLHRVGDADHSPAAVPADRYRGGAIFSGIAPCPRHPHLGPPDGAAHPGPRIVGEVSDVGDEMQPSPAGLGNDRRSHRMLGG